MEFQALGFLYGLGFISSNLSLGHVQVGSYRYRSLIESLYTLWKPYGSPIYPKLPTCSFLYFKGSFGGLEGSVEFQALGSL